MAKYVLGYHGGASPESISDEERGKIMGAWEAWYGVLGEAILDGGNPFSQTRNVAANGEVTVGGANQLTGYTIVNADDIDAAVTLAKGCPIFESGGSVEVAEAIDM